MKLTLTYDEACDYIRAALELPGDVSVMITDIPQSRESDVDEIIRKCVNEIDKMDPRRNLIATIKTLRKHSNLGLVQAKWAIEHWDDFSAFALTKGWPVLEGSYPNYTMV